MLFLSVAVISLYGATGEDTFAGSYSYFLIGAFSLYLLTECIIHLRKTDAFGLLAPPFVASLLHFLLAYILPSVAALFDPWILARLAVYLPSPSEQVPHAIWIVALAAFCMWRGYGLGRPIATRLRLALRSAQLLRRGLQPALLPVLGLQAGYVLLVSHAVSQGVFGMASSAELRERNAELLEAINIGLAGGSLSLFLLLVYVFRNRAQGRSTRLLATIAVVAVLVHLLVGAMSGFKYQLVAPFVMLAFARFVALRRISVVYVAAACVALVASYQIIEPYRAHLVRNNLQGQGDVASLVKALDDAYKESDLRYGGVPLASQILSRLDLTGMSAVGISFATDNPMVEPKSREFSESLYLSPILAYVPRFLWPDKPSYSSGVWFSNVVLGNVQDATTSVGMGPVTWLYIMGGILGVGIGFLGLGFVQALLFEGVGRARAGGFIIFLSAASVLTQVPSDFGPALVGMLRILPIAAIAQFVLLRPDRPFRKAMRGSAGWVALR